MSATRLVVDGHEDHAPIPTEAVLNPGCDGRVANNGPSALRALEEYRPDVVLLDVMMPVMDGMEVLERIRANPKNAGLPVILVTAKTQDDDVLAGYKSGADYYITKPFTARQLLHGIGLILGTEQA